MEEAVDLHQEAGNENEQTELNREPGTSDQSEENQVSTSTTTQQNVFTVNKSSLGQFLPEHILTSLKAAHLTSTFSVVISRRFQG